jgi:hypothetical protein
MVLPWNLNRIWNLVFLCADPNRLRYSQTGQKGDEIYPECHFSVQLIVSRPAQRVKVPLFGMQLGFVAVRMFLDDAASYLEIDN